MVLKQLFGKKDNKTSGTLPTVNATTHAEDNHISPLSADNQSTDTPATAELLEKAMVENIRTDTPDTRYRVYSELLFSDLLLALADPTPEQKDDPNAINVAILSNQQNVRFAAAFTSANAAKRWRPEGGGFVTMRGQDLFKLLEPSPAEVIVINAGSAPFAVIPKIEYRQLAAGIVPQSARTPVQMTTSNNPQEPQIGFPDDLLTTEQRDFMKTTVEEFTDLEAAAFGVMLPPGAKQEDGWIRTLFIRFVNAQTTKEEGQVTFEKLHNNLLEKNGLLKDLGFQMVHIPDPNFWAMVATNQKALFDKNPPAPQQNTEIQLAFPPDVFNADQKTLARSIMETDNQIEAAAIGAVLPQGADKDNGWVRTVFLRVTGIEDTQENMQKFCVEVRERIIGNTDIFKETGFEVGIMSDLNFWAAVNKENVSLFDKNPPPAPETPPPSATKEGVVDANII